MGAALRIVEGTVEPIQLYVTDAFGDALTNQNDLFVRVRRASDGKYLDWDSFVFRSTGWIERDKLLTQVDATLAPGIYEATGGMDTDNFGDVDLVVIPFQSPAGDAVLPAPCELKVGQWADLIKETHQKHFNRREIDFPNSKEILYDDDGVTPLGEQTLADGGGNSVVVLPGAPARIGKFT